MVTLLQQVIARVAELPPEEQEAIALRWLLELEDELAWEERFDATTEEQWAQMAAEVRKAIAKGDVEPLDELFASEEILL